VRIVGQVPDPGGAAPWGVKEMRRADRQTCLQIGQVRDGRLGDEIGGRFHPTPEDAIYSCTRTDERPWGTVSLAHRGGSASDRRSVVFGAVAPRVEKVVVQTPIETRTLDVKGHQSYVVAYRENLDIMDLSVLFHYADGKVADAMSGTERVHAH
jgi:hypothetical protein